MKNKIGRPFGVGVGARDGGLSEKDIFVIDQVLMSVGGMTLQAMGDHLGVSKQAISSRLQKKTVKDEIKRRRELLSKASDKEAMILATEVAETKKDGLGRLRDIIKNGSDIAAIRAFEVFLKWIGEIDSGLTVTVNNEIPLYEKTERDREEYENRMKALNGN